MARALSKLQGVHASIAHGAWSWRCRVRPLPSVLMVFRIEDMVCHVDEGDNGFFAIRKRTDCPPDTVEIPVFKARDGNILKPLLRPVLCKA